MLYGYKERLDDRVASIIPAADSTVEYDAWVDGMKGQDPSDPAVHFNEIYTSELLDHMMRDEYRGYKRPVLAVYHDNEEQRDAFFEQFAIKEVQTENARDRQMDMIHSENEEEKEKAEDRKKKLAAAMGEDYRELTIAELAGVAEHDPWDKRSEAQKASDEAMRQQMEELRSKGEISDDSFGSASEVRAARNKEREEKGLPPIPGGPGELKIDEIRASIRPDGSIELADVTARKDGGPVDDAMKKAREKTEKETIKEATGGFDLFGPDDFAAVLGEGTSEKVEKAKESADERLQKNLEEARKEEEEARDLEDRKIAEEKGLFNCVLHFSDVVDVSDLPEEIGKALEEFSGRKIKSVPVDTYPLSAQVDGNIIIPDGFAGNSGAPVVVHVHGLEQTGVIYIVGQAISVYKVGDSGESFAIYRRVEEVAGDRYMVLRIKKW